jgi:hypothetical protein
MRSNGWLNLLWREWRRFTCYQKDAFWEDLKLLPPIVKLV